MERAGSHVDWGRAGGHVEVGGGGALEDMDSEDGATAGQAFLPLWQACFKRLQATAAAPEAAASQGASNLVCEGGVVENGEDVSSNWDADLLSVLEVERRKELNRRRQRRTRAKQRVCEDVSFDNELSVEERAACIKRLQQALGPEGLDECACAACDRLVLCQVAKRTDDKDTCCLKKIQGSLTVDKSKIPQKLLDMYQAPTHLTILDGIMVSPRGIHSYTDEHESLRAWVSVCKECDRAIQRGMLPKFAIANGFFVGRLERRLQKLTIPERFMTQLANMLALSSVLRRIRE